jgi:hypothetical protein
MILSKEVRKVEGRYRNPGFLEVTVPIPANKILWVSPKAHVTTILLDFMLNMTVRELDGACCSGAAGERRIR